MQMPDTYRIDRHSCFKIVDAAQDQVYLAVTQASLLYPLHKKLEIVQCCDVHIVDFEFHVWVDLAKKF
jgi:hypothetical protein